MPEKHSLPGLHTLVQATELAMTSNSTKAEPRQESLIPPEGPTRENFKYIFEAFLNKYHTHTECKVADHIVKLYDPPTYQKKSFDPFELFEIVRDCGGIHKLQKLPRQWNNTLHSPKMDSQPKNWTQVATSLGYDTKSTNISFRIKEWLRFHHVDAYFDFLMNISNPFFDENGMDLDSASPDRQSNSETYYLSSDVNVDSASASGFTKGKSTFHRPPAHLFKKNQFECASDSSTLAGSKRSFEFYNYNPDDRRLRPQAHGPPVYSPQEHSDLNNHHLASMEKEQLISIINELQADFSELMIRCLRAEKASESKDSKIQILVKELDERENMLIRARQFKDIMVKHVDLL